MRRAPKLPPLDLPERVHTHTDYGKYNAAKIQLMNYIIDHSDSMTYRQAREVLELLSHIRAEMRKWEHITTPNL